MIKPILFLTLVAVPLYLAAQTTTAGNATKGQQIFMTQNCYYCHGTVGQGSRDGARIAATSMTADGLIRYVRKPAGAMPAFTEKVISDLDLRDIYAYLKAQPAAKAPKDIPLLEQSNVK